jgi:hypothetical protein
MKLVKNFVFAVLLACVIAISAPAGELGTPGYTGGEPTPTPTPQRAISTSEEETVVTVETSDYLFYEALAALLSMY